MKNLFLAIGVMCLATVNATPVEVNWGPSETLPVKVARPFGGFLKDGSFLVAGGTDFVALQDGSGRMGKVYEQVVQRRAPDGSWSRIGSLPHPVGEGVSCETPEGLFCAGGVAFLPQGDNGARARCETRDTFILSPSGSSFTKPPLPDLAEPVTMGAAAYDGKFVYVVGSNRVWRLELAPALQHKGNSPSQWDAVADLPGPARAQHVAVVQNGDQKEKLLVVYGGYDCATKAPLHDGYGLALSSGNWKKLAPLPANTTTIGAAFLASGHQHVLLIGGFGEQGWIARAIEGSTETDPGKLGWQRTILAYNCVTDAWCAYGTIADGDSPRCGAAAGLRKGKTPESYELVLAGGECAPACRTDAVSTANFVKVKKFGWTAWLVVGAYALLMVGMASYFIFKKKDENDYFRGGGKIPWYVAGMSIFATMLSSITFLAIPAQAYISDWRYFVMAFFIIGMAPVAICYYLPFFCRLGITSAYEYLEKRFNLGVRLFGSAAFIVFMVCRVAVVTLLPAIALNAVTGISIDACILICGVLTMVYCSLGGLEAVIWSDFVQGIVLLGGAVAVLVILILKTGPAGSHLATFWDTATAYDKNAMWDFRCILSQPVFWVVAVQGLISNLSSYTSDQCVVQRYIATPDENATKRSLWFNGCMSVFAQVVFYGIGTALFAFYHNNPSAMDVTMPKGDSILPIFMGTEMPAWLAGLVIAAVFAATISTLSANLSSASTALVTDFIKRFNPTISGRMQIRCGQVCTYVVGVLGIASALVLSRVESSALFDNFNEFIAMLTAGLTGLFFMGVFLPRVKGLAAILGLVANYFVCFGCKIFDCNVFGLKFHPFLLGGIGLAVCVLVALLASCVLREGGKDLTGLTLKTLKKDK